ncbi:MAG: NUDIX hydrolase, partial [Actinobacteria bacterium]|nr:NUDIX hydrolase [Actinomycetota bacterium]
MVVVREGTVLLVRQYRLLINRLSWEIPGGRVESGETPERAAARECLEEAGVRCRSLRPLLVYHAGLDILHNPTHVFVAEDWEATPEARGEPAEVQERTWVPLPRCLEMIVAGKIVDS